MACSYLGTIKGMLWLLIPTPETLWQILPTPTEGLSIGLSMIGTGALDHAYIRPHGDNNSKEIIQHPKVTQQLLVFAVIALGFGNSAAQDVRSARNALRGSRVVC